jgi:hypothetical protein
VCAECILEFIPTPAKELAMKTPTHIPALLAVALSTIVAVAMPAYAADGGSSSSGKVPIGGDGANPVQDAAPSTGIHLANLSRSGRDCSDAANATWFGFPIGGDGTDPLPSPRPVLSQSAATGVGVPVGGEDTNPVPSNDHSLTGVRVAGS